MSSTRYVVLGLAHVRSRWFSEVSRWATAAVMPLDFVKCVSIDELRAHLLSGRRYSAVLADAGMPGLDRDLVERARDAGAAVVLVDDGAHRDLSGLGVSALLPAGFDRAQLQSTLEAHAALIGAVTATDVRPGSPAGVDAGGWRGQLVAVTGAGGTGSSIAAMALARGLAGDVRNQGRVLLADLALEADQAMLHDARDIVPGVQELVEAFRHGTPSPAEIYGLTFGDGHPYRVLLGLRRHRDWAALRPRAWYAALDGLRRTFTQVVADVDADVEGERECGSLDVEERNLLARSVTAGADVVMVTLSPTVQGVHRAVRLLVGLVEHGVAVERMQPVVMRAPKSGRTRAEITRTIGDVLQPVLGPFAAGLASPVFIPEQKKLDAAIRDGVALPGSLCTPLASAVEAIRVRAGARPGPVGAGEQPVPVAPGSLGSWAAGQEVAG